MADPSRSSVVAVVVLLLVFAAGTYLATARLLDRPMPLVPGQGRVAILPVEGPIGAESSERLLRTLRRYREDGRVRGFLLEIESPGGTVGASQALYRELRDLREADDRPVVAWIGDVGASGGYYVALAADSVYALPGSITGSIGVIMQFPNTRGLLQKAGLSVEIVKSGERKGSGSPFRELSEEDRRVFQALVDDTYGQFLDAVVADRALPRDSARRLADGSVYSGERAVRLGLVDGLATRAEAVERLGRMAGLGPSPSTVRPEQRRIGPLDLLTDEGGEALRDRIMGWLGLTGGELTSPRLLYLWR